MAGDTERLFVQLEARISDFEKKMQRAERRGTRTYQGLSRNSRRTTRQMEQDMARSTTAINRRLEATGRHMRTFARGLAGGLFAGGVAGTVTAIQRVTRGIADIGREAERAGVGVETFQELGFVAEQNRIPIDALTDGLKELNLRADEFIVTGAGPASEAFQRLGFEADDLSERLENPSELFTEIIGRMEQLDRAAQIRVADEIFGGTAGERFVELLDEGAAKIREQIRLAHDMGIVMDEDLINRAEELDRKFNIVAQTVGNSLKRAIVEAATALAQFIDGFRSFEAQSNRSLENRLADVSRRIALAEANEARQIEDLSAVPRSIQDATLQGTTRETSLAQIRRELGEMRDERQRIADILQSRQTSAFTPPEFTPTGASADEATGARTRSAQATVAQTNAVRALIEQLQFENSLIGKSQTEIDILTAQRQAGAGATDEQRETIAQLITLRDQETDSITRQTEAHHANQAAIGYLAGSALDGLASVASGAQSAEEAVKRLALELAAAAAQAAIFGQGPLAGFFGGSSGGGLLGSVFGGFRASGGPVSPGKTYMVGERGPELFKPSRAGSIVPNHALATGPSASSQATVRHQININIGINGSVSRAEMQQMGQVITQTLRSEMGSAAINAVTTINRRQPGLIG